MSGPKLMHVTTDPLVLLVHEELFRAQGKVAYFSPKGELCRFIKEGKYTSGRILYNIDGNYIKEGKYTSGAIVFNISEKKY